MIEIEDKDKARLHGVLTEKFGITDQADLDEITTDLAETGKIRTFGYGSLIKVPHTEAKVETYNASLDGQVARFNAAFNFYGGTQKFPSLMLGLEKDEDGSTPGVVSEKSVFEEGEEPSIDGIITYLEEFDVRENPEGNPVYDFEFVRVTPMDGGAPVLAAVCITKEDGPLFVGDALTLEEKAMIIATEHGDERRRQLNGIFVPDSNLQSHHQTIYNYLVEMVDARYDKGFPVEDELADLVKAANYYRQQMPPEYRIFLEQKESRLLDSRNGNFTENLEYVSQRIKASNSEDLSLTFQEMHKESRNLDPRVFTEIAEGPDLCAEEFYALQWSARNKLREQIGMEALPELPPEYPKNIEINLDYNHPADEEQARLQM